MKIAMLAPMFLKIPPEKYGGSEYVIHYLTEGLVRNCHQVDLYATADSVTKANLIPICQKGLLGTTEGNDINTVHLEMIYRVALGDYDVIHDHLGPLGTIITKITKTPVVSTLHVPMNKERERLYKTIPDFHLISISDAQRRGFEGAHYLRTIYHGIPVDDYEFNSTPEDYLVFLGRFSEVKGIKEAISLSKRTNTRLKIAARIENEGYFNNEIKPLIDDKLIEYIGEVDFKQKIKLLKNAKALVSLIKWEEPFGLVVPEANACGTPVIVNPRGAFPELVKNGINGFLTDGTLEGAVEALKKIDQIDRLKCQQFVKNNFSVEKMVFDYETTYQELIKLK